ncbi:MAG: hypothetical protein U1F52_06860 [Burkholderiales bacterium]
MECVFVAGLALLAGHAAAAELVMTSAALERVVVDQAFGKDGRLHFMAPTACSHAYLDGPQVAVAKGRVILTGRLHGRAGVLAGDGCVEAMNDALDVVASGRPFVRNGRIGLDDVRLDQLSNEFYRPLLEPLLFATIGRVVDIDLRDAVKRMLAAGRAPIAVEVERLDVSRLTAENDRLEAVFDFRAVSR